MIESFRDMYKIRDYEKVPFGDHWCVPTQVLQHGEDTLIATYPPTSEDGHEAKVYCTAMPARFYGLVADGIHLRTGSGSDMARLVSQMAEAIAEGMLGVEKEEKKGEMNDDTKA